MGGLPCKQQGGSCTYCRALSSEMSLPCRWLSCLWTAPLQVLPMHWSARNPCPRLKQPFSHSTTLQGASTPSRREFRLESEAPSDVGPRRLMQIVFRAVQAAPVASALSPSSAVLLQHVPCGCPVNIPSVSLR